MAQQVKVIKDTGQFPTLGRAREVCLGIEIELVSLLWMVIEASMQLYLRLHVFHAAGRSSPQ